MPRLLKLPVGNCDSSLTHRRPSPSSRANRGQSSNGDIPSPSVTGSTPGGMARRIGVGVIGVGANWRRRYRPALEALGRFRVHAVFDPAYDRADQEARSLGCGVADHLTALVEAAAVEAVILAGAGWYGLW